MSTTNNITTSTGTININNNTEQIINQNPELLDNNLPNVNIPIKVCNTCRTIKYVTEFYKDKSKKDNYRTQCKTCNDNRRKKYLEENKDQISNAQKQYYNQNKDTIAKYRKEYCNENKDKLLDFHKDYYKRNRIKLLEHKHEYYIENQDKIIAYNKEYRVENKEKLYENHKEYYNQNSEKILQHQKEFREQNKDRLIEHRKEFHEQNKDRLNQYRRNYEKNQRDNNPIVRLKENIRKRISQTLKSNSKASNTIELFGCNKEFFYFWIKWQMSSDISDDEFKTNWHIDHVKPISSFNLSNKEEQYEAFCWTNCAPLLKSKNLSKGAKRDLYSEVLQELKVRVFLKLYYPDEC